MLDDDLSFAAWATSGGIGHLQEFRKRAIGVLRELVSRWRSVDEHLRQFQSVEIRRVTSARNVGVPGLLMILLSWGDFSYPHGLIKGLPAVGLAPNYGVFPVQPAQFLSFEDVLADADANNASILAGLRPGKDDAFLLSQSCKDAEDGFCSSPMTKTELLSMLRGKRFRLIPRCVITQANGKQRIIDDAARGGQSALSADRNKLVLCAPHCGRRSTSRRCLPGLQMTFGPFGNIATNGEEPERIGRRPIATRQSASRSRWAA